MNVSRGNRLCLFPLLRSCKIWLGAVLLWFVAGAAVAETAPDIREPDEAEIRQAVEDLLLCRWISSKHSPHMFQVLEHLSKQRKQAPGGDEIEWLEGKFLALDLEFNGLGAIAVYGGAAAFGWSASATSQDLLAALSRRGFEPYQSVQQPQEGLIAELARVEDGWRYLMYVSEGVHEELGLNVEGGVTLGCTAEQTEEQKQADAERRQRYARIKELVESGEQQPRSWVEQILAEGSENELQLLAGYAWLQPQDVEHLLAIETGQIGIANKLITNPAVTLNREQLDGLVENDVSGMFLIKYRLDQLSPEQLQLLAANPHTSRTLTLARGGPDAAQALREALQAGDESTLRSRDLNFLPAVPAELLDVILSQGSERLQMLIEDRYKPDYTAEQLEQVLAHGQTELHIRLVGRRKLPLTLEQYERGLMHPDGRNIAFWYHQREDRQPSAQLAEQGLTSPDPQMRARWLHNRQIRLDAQQMARALADENADLRGIAYTRKDVALTDAQLDVCLQEDSISARFACVKRPEMRLTGWRFERMVSDRNPNVLRDYVKAHELEQAQLAEHVSRLAQEGDEKQLRDMARFVGKELPVTEEDVRVIHQRHSEAVSRPYCRLLPQACQ